MRFRPSLVILYHVIRAGGELSGPGHRKIAGRWRAASTRAWPRRVKSSISKKIILVFRDIPNPNLRDSWFLGFMIFAFQGISARDFLGIFKFWPLSRKYREFRGKKRRKKRVHFWTSSPVDKFRVLSNLPFKFWILQKVKKVKHQIWSNGRKLLMAGSTRMP